jgi:TatD DNase family protein
MRLVDTHTHLDFPDFDADRSEVLGQARRAGVERMVVLGVYQDNWQRVWELVKSDPQLYAAFGLHPVYLEQHRPEHLLALGDWLSRLRGDRQLCAVGEFGLDYYVAELDRERQQALFEAQLQLAVDFDLPALLHVRRSHADVIARLKRFKLARGGIVHAFAGSYEEAREYRRLGFRLGRLRKVLPRLGLDGVVLETDSPDMAPAMYAGVRNSPVHLPQIAVALAEVMGVAPQVLAEASTRNACELFGW